MKIATWNVNSIRVRLSHLCQFLTENSPDIVALQETKCEDEKFPLAEINALGYQAIYHGQKSYNGVAVLAKKALTIEPLTDYFTQHEQKRVLAVKHDDTLIVDVYIPNGQAVGSEKYIFKLAWLQELLNLLKTLKSKYPRMILLGDFNIAPEEIDHTSANFIKDKIMISETERELFQQMIALGFYDSFRLFNKEAKQYTWWDYRIRAFDKNLGYRIDHILVTEALVKECIACEVEKTFRALDKPSDHAPVVLTLSS
jgi:exodeoxyribonuclease-3